MEMKDTHKARRDVIDIVEFEGVVNSVLSEEKYYGKQALLSIDDKVLHGTLDKTLTGSIQFLMQDYWYNFTRRLTKGDKHGKCDWS
jgi:hypothetical protein